MALLGMGSNMESNSHFRRFCLMPEIGGNGKDCTWSQIVDDKLLNGGRFSDGLFPELAADCQSELNKEVLKQIMLKHESIFRDQIYELHRLYQRQRDLMAELKYCKLGKHGERTQSNITSSRALTGYDWTTFQVPKFPCPEFEYSQSSVSAREKVLLPSIQVNRKEKCLHPMHIESESKCRKFGKKILDLELPAEEYIDSEEEWPLKDTAVPIVSKNPLAENNETSIVPRSDELLSPTLSGKFKIMADLNEPINIEDEAASTTPKSQSFVEDGKEVGLELATYHDANEPGISEKASGSDVNLNCYMESISEIQAVENELVSRCKSDRKLLHFGTHFDLNTARNEDGSSSTSNIDLEAPPSSRDDEWSPGEKHGEGKLEMSCPKFGKDDRNLQEELVRIAVEAMICISSSDFQTPPKDTSFHRSETPFDSLRWFSRIVCSTIGNSESKVRSAFRSKNPGDCVELLENGVDYFEAMTLKLEDTKVEEHLLHNNDIKGEGKSDKPSSGQPLKGRTRRGRQRKDFQSEILPGLVSLSRYEVTEDLQMIGGLMEVTSRGRNGSFKRKRQLCLMMDSQSKLCLAEESRVGWGRIRRRRRGRRFPARNPQLIIEHLV